MHKAVSRCDRAISKVTIEESSTFTKPRVLRKKIFKSQEGALGLPQAS